MPNAPRYTPQVQEQGLPNARFNVEAPIEAFGGGQSFSRAVDAGQGALDHVSKIAAAEKDKADDLATTDAYNKLVTVKNDLIYNPQTGAMTKRGKNAFGVIDEYQPQFDKQAQEIEKGLSNETQRAMFRRMRDKEGAELNGTLNRHLHQEKTRFDDETTMASLANVQNDAVMNYHVPGKVEDALRTQAALIQAHAGRTGKDAEWVKEAQSKAASGTHRDIVERLIANGQDLAAKDYYAKAREQVTNKDDATSIEKMLEVGSVRGESQRQADRIAATAIDRSDAMEQAKKVKDPEVRDALEQRLEKIYDRKAEELKAGSSRIFMRSVSALMEAKQRKGASASVFDIPDDQWAALSAPQRKAMEALAKQDGTVHSEAAYGKWLAKSEAELAEVTEPELIEQARPYLSTQAFDDIMRRWGRVQQIRGNQAKREEVKSLFTDDELVLNLMAQSKVGGIAFGETKADVGNSEEKAAAFAGVKSALDAKVAAYAYEHGGKSPDGEWKKKAVGDILKERVFVPGNWYGGEDVPVAALTEAQLERATVKIQDVPKGDRQLLINLARANGVISPQEGDDAALRILRNRIERAYAAARAGASRSRILEIMSK